MKLNVQERIVLLNLLPKESDFMTLKLMRIFREDLSFSDDEMRRAQIKRDGENIQWDNDDEVLKDIEVGETMFNLVRKTLKKMDEESKLTLSHVTLYEKFVEEKEESESEAPEVESEIE